MKELVSAIITTHNRRELLRRAIDSVFSQTYPIIELIVVDDHSDDGTNEICKDPRINYIFIPKEESRGGNYARNLGVKASKGKYCAFLDDDDYWLPTKIEKQMLLINQMDCELVHCGRKLEIVHHDRVEYDDFLPIINHSGDMSKRILQTICTTTSCIMVKREALLNIGLFDENLMFWQEYELTIRLAQRSPFYYVNEPLVVYRIDKSDMNRLTNKYREWQKAVEYIRNKHSQLYTQLSYWELYKVKILIWEDAERRCKLSGLYYKAFYFRFLLQPIRILRKVNKFAKSCKSIKHGHFKRC